MRSLGMVSSAEMSSSRVFKSLSLRNVGGNVIFYFGSGGKNDFSRSELVGLTKEAQLGFGIQRTDCGKLFVSILSRAYYFWMIKLLRMHPIFSVMWFNRKSQFCNFGNIFVIHWIASVKKALFIFQTKDNREFKCKIIFPTIFLWYSHKSA